VITLDAALAAARQTLATVTKRAERGGYYTGERTGIINSHAELCAALDMLIRAAGHAAARTPPEPAPGPARDSPTADNVP
jgi:hypothetical protein